MEKTQIVSLNNQIGKCASRKDATGAEALFQQLTDASAANTYSYSNMINVYVQCGDIESAKRIFDQLKAEKKMRPDIVSCTSLLKGYSRAGDLASAQLLLKDMDAFQPTVIPNIRTLNTFLRCCVVSGAVKEASAIFSEHTKTHKIVPDVSSWEYLGILLSQTLDVDKMLPLLGRLKGDEQMISGLGLLHICLARSCAILGDSKACRRALKQAEEFLEKNEVLERDASASTPGAAVSSAEGRVLTGGKRAWRDDDDAGSRGHSLSVYRQHRSAELRQEIANISSFIAGGDAAGAEHSQQAGVHSTFYRVFSFPPKTAADASVDDTVRMLLEARNVKFGFELFAQKNLPKVEAVKASHSKQQQGKKAGKRKREELASAPLPSSSSVVSYDSAMEAHLRLCLQNHPYLDFAQVFSVPSATAVVTVAKGQQVKLEVGAGGGEWAAAQAERDSASNWVTLELRHDRVYEAFSKAVYRRLGNMCVVGGDALEVIPQRFAPESTAHIFVNYPEPPQQTGSSHDYSSQSKHLLCPEFFQEAARILEVGGRLTILTDNQWYAKHLLRYLQHSSGQLPLKSCKLNNPAYSVLEDSAGFRCYEGTPGTDAGHVAAASSYFDRMWTRSEQPRRFFFVLQKVTMDASALKNNVKAATTVPSSLTSKNKKIKFSDA